MPTATGEPACTNQPCPGPLVWFEVSMGRPCTANPAGGSCWVCAGPTAAVLECAHPGCRYVVATGPAAFNDWRHAAAAVMREGLAS